MVDCEASTVEVYTKQFLEISRIPLRVFVENVDSGMLDAEPIVRKLSTSKRESRLINALNVLGIVPLNKLLDMSTSFKASSDPKELGIVPVNLLKLTVNCTNDVMVPRMAGRVPTRELRSR